MRIDLHPLDPEPSDLLELHLVGENEAERHYLASLILPFFTERRWPASPHRDADGDDDGVSVYVGRPVPSKRLGVD